MKKADFTDKFSNLTDKEQNIVKEIVSHFHFRDGIRQKDNSVGTITITPGQLRDCLAYALKDKE